MLDLRSEGPYLPLEALLCAQEAERLRTGERTSEVLLTREQMTDVYTQMQSMARFEWPSAPAGNVRWNGMTLRCEEDLSVCSR